MRNKGNGKAIKFIREALASATDDCILWTFATMPNGYGHFGYLGKVHYAHRYVCEQAHGPMQAPGLHAAHSCHRRNCINLRHISWKTLSENMLDKRDNGTANNAWWGRKGKLTAEQAAEIVGLKDKEPQATTAKRFGVTESNIRKIQTGKTWAVRIAALKAA